MFAYDSSKDQYNEVLEPELSEAIELSSLARSTAIRRSFSGCSSRSSIRSVKRNIFTRIITKTGRLNTHLSRLPQKHISYLLDIGYTLLSIQWRWIMTTVFLVNFAIFFIFGGMWMWLAYSSGDFEANATELCVVNAEGFAGYMLLSAETIMTIGYGYRYPTEKCNQAWIVMGLQAFISATIQGALISAVYVKIAKPVTRNGMSLFSKKAVINLRNGNLCLIVRISDLFGKISIGTKISMFFVEKNPDFETDHVFEVKELKVEPHGFLIFPMEIVHVIDASSPLYEMTPYQFMQRRYEIMVVAEGNSSVTGQLSQNKTSYVCSDVMWGHRFRTCVEFDYTKKAYTVEHRFLNRTLPFNTPLCSAQELQAIKERSANCSE